MVKKFFSSSDKTTPWAEAEWWATGALLAHAAGVDDSNVSVHPANSVKGGQAWL